jgi:hypothetical protein
MIFIANARRPDAGVESKAHFCSSQAVELDHSLEKTVAVIHDAASSSLSVFKTVPSTFQ